VKLTYGDRVAVIVRPGYAEPNHFVGEFLKCTWHRYLVPSGVPVLSMIVATSTRTWGFPVSVIRTLHKLQSGESYEDFLMRKWQEQNVELLTYWRDQSGIVR